nr:MAG: RNA-dependent RNA polymerase [Xinjiang sediment orthophasma-like virus]
MTKVDAYKALHNSRHDVWLYYLSCVTKSDIKDTKVSDFIKELNELPDFKSNKVKAPPAKIKNKSPDILVYRRDLQSIIMGDVTVSEMTYYAVQLKRIKYQPIFEHLAQHARVVEYYLAIDEDLSNIEVVLKGLEDIQLCKNDDLIKNRCITLHKDINNAMKLGITLMRENERNDFLLALSNASKQNEGIDYSEYTEGLEQMPVYEPIKPVQYYVDQIKKQTDEHFKTMFDDNYEPAERAFIELEENLRKQDSSTFLQHPKSPLQICENSSTIECFTSHDLINDYITDLVSSIALGSNKTQEELDTMYYILNLFPNCKQLELMANYKEDNRTENAESKVYGNWQYTMTPGYDSAMYNWFKSKVKKGRKDPNEKKQPQRVHPDQYPYILEQMENYLDYLGDSSEKPNFMEKATWEAKTSAEVSGSSEIKEVFKYVSGTNGVQLATAMNQAYQRIIHLSANKSRKTNVFVPPNGSFIMIIPKDHAPLTQANVDIPFVTVTRRPKTMTAEPLSYHAKYTTCEYNYYVSKLSRINADKMETWDQSQYKIVMTATYLGSKMNLDYDKLRRLIGIVTMYSLDTHQKTSELLDLYKYVVYMPLSSLSMLSKLVKDKFDIMLKTHLDVWTLKETEEFMKKLSTYRDNPRKPKLKVHQGRVLNQSYGIDFKLPSFAIKGYEHKKIEDYIDETSAYFTLRGKKFGGNQFMQRSIAAVAEYDMAWEDEQKVWGDWVTKGYSDSDYPFESNYAFSSDMIYYATRHRENSNTYNHRNARVNIQKQDMLSPVHYMCSLRGSLKTEGDMKHDTDYHSTSLHEALKYYEKIGYDESKCTLMALGIDAIKNNTSRQIESAKEQRGPGRPINTPDLPTKAMYALIELPERTITDANPMNVMAQNRNKLKYLEQTYKNACELLVAKKVPFVAQVTEDQTKYSEQDNTEKFRVYVRSSTIHRHEIRQIQYNALSKFKGRIHIEKNMPDIFDEVKGDPRYSSKLRRVDNQIKCREVVLNIGWPQGMLNYISTNVHEIAFSFVVTCYKMAYPKDEIYLFPLVHSDDSWYTIGYVDPISYRRFCTFLMYYKRMFCLKVNMKKWWSSPIGGEMVSNLNFNGETIKSLSKTIANCTQNLLFQTYPIDAMSRVSALQQMIREGADMPVLIMCHTVLKHQLFSNYNMVNKQRLDIDYSMLPIEMGGYPDISTFELATTGLKGHYFKIWKYIVANPHSQEAIMVLKLATLSQEKRMKEMMPSDTVKEFEEEAYYQIAAPEKPDVFIALKHKMPKIKKIAQTLNAIDKLPYVDDGLGLIMGRALDLKQALGHLKGQTRSQVYALASEHYSSKKRRMAVSQTIQSTGKTVILNNLAPMTIDEALLTLFNMDVHTQSSDHIKMAFHDEGEVTDIAYRTVHMSTITDSTNPKTKQINRMPQYKNIFQTTTKFPCVLLSIYDKNNNTEFAQKLYPSEDRTHLSMDMDFITKRFGIYFRSYPLTKALSLIHQQFHSQIKTRLFNQPKLRTDDIVSFITDLYGCTLNKDQTYNVTISVTEFSKTKESRTLDTLYTAEQLYSIYSYFKPLSVNINNTAVDKKIFIKNLDVSELEYPQQCKHAILMKLYFNLDQHIEKIDKGGQYRQSWIQRQEFNRKKRCWGGPFKLLATMGGVVCMIHGNDDQVHGIQVNKFDIKRTLELLHTFVKLNFRACSYPAPGCWGQSSLFRKVKNYHTYLTYHNSESTEITNEVKPCPQIPCGLYKSLTYNPIQDEKPTAGYDIDPYLRRVMYSGTYASAFSVGSHLPIPDPKSVNLVPETYEGFLTSELFERRIINNMTLLKLDSINYSDLIDMISMKQDDTVIADMVNAIYYNSKKTAFKLVQTEMIFIPVNSVKPSEIQMDNITYSEPGSMAYDVIDDDDYYYMHNGLYKVTGLLFKMCNIVGISMTKQDIVDLTYKMLRIDYDAYKEFKELCRDNFSGPYGALEIIDSDHGGQLPTTIFATIIKNNLLSAHVYTEALIVVKSMIVKKESGKSLVFIDKSNDFVNKIFYSIMDTITHALYMMSYESMISKDDDIMDFIDERLATRDGEC